MLISSYSQRHNQQSWYFPNQIHGSDLKNEIREKVTNNIMYNFNKDTHISMENRNFASKLKVTKQFLKNNPDIFFY